MVTESSSGNDDNSSKVTGSSGDNGFQEFPNKTINRQIAVVSTLAAVGLFLSSRLDFGVSLKDLTAAALPYEEVCQISLYPFHKVVAPLHCVWVWEGGGLW